MGGIEAIWAKGDAGVIFFLAAIIEVALKGYSMWFAARNSQKAWFVAILLLNTIGILPLIYLFFFRPKETVVRSAAPKKSSLSRKKKR